MRDVELRFITGRRCLSFVLKKVIHKKRWYARNLCWRKIFHNYTHFAIISNKTVGGLQIHDAYVGIWKSWPLQNRSIFHFMHRRWQRTKTFHRWLGSLAESCMQDALSTRRNATFANIQQSCDDVFECNDRSSHRFCWNHWKTIDKLCGTSCKGGTVRCMYGFEKYEKSTDDVKKSGTKTYFQWIRHRSAKSR